jgi:hypothetical protein
MATGASRWDALVALAEAGGEAALAPLGIPAKSLKAYLEFKDARAAFDRLAKRDPVGANLALNAYLEGRTLDDNVVLKGRPWITSLPEGLRVMGFLRLDGTGITRLPDRFTVGRWLAVDHTPLESLPEGLTVNEFLDISYTQVKALPERFRVGGYLNLSHTGISALPDGLAVDSFLSLNGCPIATLPAGLRVNGLLSLKDTPVRALPEDLVVSESLVLTGSRIERLPDCVKKVGGSLHLDQTPITALPDGLEVTHYLTLEGASIRSLPAGLAVKGSLILNGCADWDGRIPEDAKVGFGKDGGWVFSGRDDLGERGVSAEAWRTRFPHGFEGGGDAGA